MSDLVSGLTAPPAPAIPLASVSGNLGLQFSPPPGQVQAQAQPQTAPGGGDVILRDAGGEYRVPKAEYDSLQAGGYQYPGTVVSRQGDSAPQQPPTHAIDRGVPLTGQDHAHQFIDWIGRNEGATWGTLYGNAPGWSGRLTQEGKPIVNGQTWQGASGPDGRPTHAFGKGQFEPGTWKKAVQEINRGAQTPESMIDVTDASPVNQARVLLHLAQKRDPHFLDKFAAGDRAGLAATLGNEWPSLQPHSGSGSSGSTLDLRETALGPFNASAQAMVQNLSERYAKANQYYDQRIAKSERLETAAEAALAQWQAESTKPPQNMHEAWSQWNGIASVFALLGGLVGRNHTAAIAAAGTMLQAANSADSATYDRAYKQWSDHLDRGMKITELLLRDAREIASDATKPLHEINTELSTLSTAYQLYKSLDPNDVHNLILKDQQLRAHRDLIDAQNEQSEIRNAATAKDQSWLQAHPEANGAVPPEIHNQHTGDAERERKGMTVSGQVMQFKMSQAAELEAQGVPHEEALRRVGLIPQFPKQAAGSEEAKFIESQVSTDWAAKQSKGEPYTADDEQASRLKAREDWSRSAAAGRVAAGRPESASDRALQWKMNRARELIGEGKSADEAYRMVGLEPQQRAAGLETQFIQGSVAQAEAEAESQGRPFTEADRNGAIAAAHQEWSRRTAAGRAEARPAVVPGGIEGQFVQGEVAAAEARAKESGRPFTQDDRNAAMAAAAQEWERRKATGRVEAGRAVSATDQLKIDAYQGLLAGQKEQYRSAHDGKDPDGPELTKMQTSALRDAGIIRASATTGDLSPESVKMLAQLYTLGDTSVITSLPRGGQARIQVENEVAKQLEETGRGAGDIALNRLKMAEARAAATTAGRVTVLTELFSQEAESAGREVVRTSKLFTRTNYPAVNQALEAFALQTGDPNIISFGQALSGFINAYGKLSNPTGVGVHDADKARVQKNLQERLSQGQIEAGVEQVITEGRIVSNAAREAQIKVLAGLVPRTDGAAAPGAPPPPAASPPPAGGKPPIESFFR